MRKGQDLCGYFDGCVNNFDKIISTKQIPMSSVTFFSVLSSASLNLDILF